MIKQLAKRSLRKVLRYPVLALQSRLEIAIPNRELSTNGVVKSEYPSAEEWNFDRSPLRAVVFPKEQIPFRREDVTEDPNHAK